MTDIKDDVSVDGEITATGDVTDGAGNKLSEVSSSVANILNGTTIVPKAGTAVAADYATSARSATNATYLGSGSASAGSNLKPIKIVNGQAVAVANDLVDVSSAQTITGKKTMMADVDIGAVGNGKNVNMVGDLTIRGNITQNGSAYETHAEKIYTTKDYIYLREGATGALSPGDYTGMEAEKYDGTNNGRLVFDSSGTARVGDVGDEQPLMTRDESADMTDGALLCWDATGSKAVSNTMTLCRKYSGSVSVATSSWAASGITAYPYKADITVTGITANDYPTVAFAQAEAVSGNYSPECDTSAGTLTIYAKAVPSAAITISYMILQDVS